MFDECFQVSIRIRNFDLEELSMFWVVRGLAELGGDRWRWSEAGSSSGRECACAPCLCVHSGMKKVGVSEKK